MSIMETFNREPPSKRKEESDGQDRKPKPHEMGMQVPHCVHTERAKKGVVRAVEEAAHEGVSRARATQGKSDRRGAHDVGPRSHADIDTSKVFGVTGCGVHQGEKRDLFTDVTQPP
jgi:hypothetical protein